MNIGDRFFTLYDNEVREFVITKIITETTIRGNTVTYYAVGYDRGFNSLKCFKTKQELIQSL